MWELLIEDYVPVFKRVLKAYATNDFSTSVFAWALFDHLNPRYKLTTFPSGALQFSNSVLLRDPRVTHLGGGLWRLRDEWWV